MTSDVKYAGELAALLTTLSWTFCIFPFTIASRKLGAGPLNHFRLLLASLFLTVLVLVFTKFPFASNYSLPTTFYFLLSGIIGLAMGDFFGFSGFAILGPRVGSVFTTLAPIATLLSGYFFVEERINAVGVLGIFITIGSVAALSFSPSEIKKVKESGHGNFYSGILFMILSSSCQGFGLVLANKGFETGGALAPDPIQATWLRMIAGTVVIFLFSAVTGKLGKMARPIINNEGNGNWYALAGTIFGPVTGVMMSMLAVSLLKNQPSIAQTIFSLLPALALPLNYAFYREKITWRQLLIVAGAVGGVMILVWRDQLLQMQ